MYRRQDLKIQSITLDCQSLPGNANDDDWWQLWITTKPKSKSKQRSAWYSAPKWIPQEVLLAHLTRKSPQIQIGIGINGRDYSIDTLEFYLKSSKSGVVYVNGYMPRGCQCR